MTLTITGYKPLSTSDATEHESRRIINKAKLYSYELEHEKAIEEAGKAIKLSSNAWNYFFRGMFYGKSGKIESALLDIQKAIKIEPDNPLYHRNAGIAYERLQQLPLAINEYNLTLNFFNGDSKAYIRLAVTYINIDKCDMAIETIKKGYEHCDDFGKKLFSDIDFSEWFQEHPMLKNLILKDSVLSKKEEFTIK